MADGNIGSLWMSLGLKDEVTNGLKKIRKEIEAAGDKSILTKRKLDLLGKALNEPGDAKKAGAALSKLTELLEKSKTDAKELAVALKALNAKDVLSLFEGKLTANNAKSYLETINRIKDAISGLGRAPGLDMQGLFRKLDEAGARMSAIAKIKDNIKDITDFGSAAKMGPGSDIEHIVQAMKTARTEMIAAMNGGYWNGAEWKEIKDRYSRTQDWALRVMQEQAQKMAAGQQEATKATEAGTAALKAEEEQARKTAAAERELAEQKGRQAKAAEAGILDRLVGGNVARMKMEDIARAAATTSARLAELETSLKKDAANGDKNDILPLREAIRNAQTFLDLVQQIDMKSREVARRGTELPNLDTKKIDEAKRLLGQFYETLQKIATEGKGTDGSLVMGNMPKALTATMREVRQLMADFAKENPLSPFVGGKAKADVALSNLAERYGKLRDLMADGGKNGYGTEMLTERANQMKQLKAELESLMQPENKGRLQDRAYMTNLLSNVAVEMTQAKNAMSEYGREKAKVMAREKADAERTAQVEKNTRKLSELYAEAEKAREKAEKEGMRSVGLGIDTSKLDSAIGKMRELSEAIHEANRKTVGLRGWKSLEDYETSLKNVRASLDRAVSSQKELNAAQEKANRDAKRKAEAEEAAAKRETAALERRAQSEARAAESRYNSLSQMLWKLRAETEKSVGLNVDTSAAERKIRELEEKIVYVASVMGDLKRGDTGAVGKLGSVGTGRDLTLAGRTLAEQKELNAAQEKANREKQAAIELERKHQAEVARTAARVRGDLARAFEQAKEKSSGMSQTMQDLKSLLMQGGVVYGAQQFLMSVIQTGGELEKQHIALQSILGDMQNANTMFAQVKELALNSPFTFSELNKDVKQLAAYGVEYDQLYDTTKRLADMSSGLGVSFERIALAFGQVQARGWLDGKELRQIAYAGIPLLDKLSDYYSKREGRKVTTSEVKTRISGRGVDFEDVKNVFWEMTDAGGQFYNMQQVLSETLLGRWNKLKDAWEIMLADFASGNSAVGSGLKGIINLVTELVQSLHTLAPVVAAAMSGPLLAKMTRGLGGGMDKALLSAKGSVATDLTRRALAGEKLTAAETRILQTKRQITAEDIKALARTNALTKAELRRLAVTGRITAEMYRQGMALAQEGAQEGGMGLKALLGGNIGTRLRGLGGLALGGLKTAFSSVVSFFGGLPGIAISAGLAIFGWYEQKSAELERKMEQTADELEDRYKQMGDFLKENSADKAIKSGDAKEVDNMIDAYKEKLRQIAPLSAEAYVMKADERESHEERLRYLEAQLKMLQDANKLAQDKAGDEDEYEKISGNTEKLRKAAEDMTDLAKMKVDYSGEKEDFDKYVENVKEFYKRTYPKLLTSGTQQEAYRAMRDNLIAASGATEEQAKVMRSAIDRALGLKDLTMERELAEKLTGMVDKTFPEIANRIRAHEELDAESKKKVQNLMRGATSQMAIEYGYFEADLKAMLKRSDFEAVIHLVYETGGQMGDLEKQVYDNITGGIYKPGSDAWKKQSEKYAALKPYLKGVTEYYDATNKVKTALDGLWNELSREKKMLDKGKLGKDVYEKTDAKYQTLKNAAQEGLAYAYVPEDKKSDKTKKGNGRDTDTALEELQRQIGDLKAARQMYEKYKGIGMGKAQARNKVMGLFGNLKGDKVSLDDYEGSVRRLMAGFDFGKSEERKKAKTSLEREMAEWDFSETLKPEWDRVAANFKEALEKGVKQADLEQELLEKTGSKELAAQAWKDGAVWDAQTLRMRDEFKEMTGEDVDWTMADADAKKLYEDNQNAYTLWQKITQMVTDKYVKSLRQAAEIMSETATTEEKIAAIGAKYAERIREAEQRGDRGVAERYRQQQKKEENAARTEAFKQGADYLSFYEAVTTLGADKAQEIARQIRENLNQALADGSIDAREYAKQAEQLEEQLEKLASGRKTLWNAGFGGKAEGDIKAGSEKFNAGTIKVGEGERLIREGRIEGDEQKVLRGEGLVMAGKVLKDAGAKLMEAGRKMKKDWEGAVKKVDKIDQVVQGLSGAFGDIKDTASALGVDTDTNGWQDAQAVMDSLSGMSKGVKGIVNGAATGDVAGVIEGAVGVITSPIKAFATAHDAKKDRQIKLAERNVKELERIEASVKTLIEKTLGGVYSYTMDADTRKTLEKVEKSWRDGTKGIGGMMSAALGKGSSSQYTDETYKAAQAAIGDPTNAYKTELALTLAQRDELQRQRDNEAGKKKKDKDKLADYDEELKQIGQTIKSLSEDYLKEMYSIDMKSWASQLTDAVVGAWEKGEDAMDAYRKKAKELVKDVTQTVVSQKLMEKALEKPLEYLEGLVEEKGRLDEGDMGKLVDELTKAGEDAVYNITAVMDALKAQGYDFSESGTGSVSNSVKNITEETADVLASYLNAIRLDVGVNRANVRTLTELMREQMPEMGQIQRAQLAQLTQIVSLAEARNEKLDRMMDWMSAVTTSGRKKVYVG